MADKWKVMAIVFMILFIIETIILIWAFSLGTEMIDNENECAYNICDGYDVYQYDDYNEVCYCYDNDNEITYQEYIG